MICPNCKTDVNEDDIYPSFSTNSLLCCKVCVRKIKHFAIIGTDAALTYNEANVRIQKKYGQETVHLKGKMTRKPVRIPTLDKNQLKGADVILGENKKIGKVLRLQRVEKSKLMLVVELNGKF